MNEPLLPRDAALPHLGLALDTARMASVFTAMLRQGGALLHGLEIDRIKYRAGRNLSVAYLLHLQDDQGRFTQRAAARLCSGGESARHHAQAARRRLGVSRAGPSLSHLPALDMLVHWWPNDLKLEAGSVLADAEALQGCWIPEVVRALGCGPCVAHQVDLAQLVPEQRVTARLQLHTADAGGMATHTVYAKADVERRGHLTHQVMQGLWASAARHQGLLRVPRPLLWQAPTGLQWQAAVPGVALLDLCPRPDAAREAAVGGLVANLHATAAPMAPLLDIDTLAQRLKQVVKTVAQVQPELQPRLHAVAAALHDGLVELSAAAPSTLHGDLHPRNVLVDGECLSLIDFDAAHRGPAVLEIGAWRAEAMYRGQLEGHDWAATEAASRAFLLGYAEAGGDVFSPRQLAWATAWQLLCQRVWRCVVNLKPGRYALVPGLLALTEALLAGRELPASACMGDGA